MSIENSIVHQLSVAHAENERLREQNTAYSQQQARWTEVVAAHVAANERLRSLDQERVAAIADLGATVERLTTERDAARMALAAYVRAVTREDVARAYEQQAGGTDGGR